MPRFAANLSMLYDEHAFLDRFAAAARDGFDAVEYLFPYAYPAEALAERLRQFDLKQVLFNAPPGDWDRGERGIACLPGREEAFRRGIDSALDYAASLACPRVHVMAGLAPDGIDRRALRAVYVANLAWAAGRAASRNVDILIEPINTRDIPRFFLNRQDDAHAIVAEVGAANLKVQMICTTARSSKATSRRSCGSTCRPATSAICRSPAFRSGTNRRSVNSTTTTCSR